jgi:hypothetical protein
MEEKRGVKIPLNLPFDGLRAGSLRKGEDVTLTLPSPIKGEDFILRGGWHPRSVCSG